MTDVAPEAARSSRVGEFENELGRVIKEARERRGLSQRALVKLLRENGMLIDASALARIEKRDGSKPRAISFGEAAIVSSVLGFDLKKVMNASEPPKVAFKAISQLFNTDVERLRSVAKSLAWQTVGLVEVLQRDKDNSLELPWMHPDIELVDLLREFSRVVDFLRAEGGAAFQPITIFPAIVEDFQTGLEFLVGQIVREMFAKDPRFTNADRETDG